MRTVSVGDILVAQGLITATQLEEVQAFCMSNLDTTLEDVILRRGLCSQDALRACVARYNDFAIKDPDPEECISYFERNSEQITERTTVFDTLTQLILNDG
jgi:ATP/maltotriose-dependent transcriptional regulator MalT